MLGGSGCQGKRSCQEKPGGDDGDAHTADQSESSPLVRHPSHPRFYPKSTGPEQSCHPWASGEYDKGLWAPGIKGWSHTSDQLFK